MPFLVEIGCEEIPARFLAQTEKDFGEKLQAALGNFRLLPGGGGPRTASTTAVQSYSTPRRIAAYFPAILARQADAVEEILGPPVKVAFDAGGKPTRAAESFAARNSAQLRDLVRVVTPKGEYLAIKKTVRGRPASEIIADTLPGLITGLNFPKSMYWAAQDGKPGPHFVRPIRWLLALLGEGKKGRVIPLGVAGVKSGAATFGHRTMGRAAIRVGSFGDYGRKLRAARVEFDHARRGERVRHECKVILEGSKLKAVRDQDLEDWVVNSTEWPRAILGSFEERFLKLPREVLITVMRDHQKYFAVEDRKGSLQPRFVAVLNVDPDKQGIIRAGHERVLKARFSDAEFFWAADQRLPLSKRAELLAGVTYQAELGSYAEKVRRMKSVALEMSHLLASGGQFTPDDVGLVRRTVKLAKSDLTTQMVQEFPELQGVMGGLYARAQGEPAEVAHAIYDHYLPQGLEDECPRSVVGAVVSLADKIDSVAAGFAVGREPTGSSDPFALRRQGNGIVRVLLELSLGIELKPLIEHALNSLDIKWKKPKEEVFGTVIAFLGERLRYYLEAARPSKTRLRYDTVRAVMAAGWDPPLEALKRAEALEAVRDSEDFEALSVAAKRIKNILAKSAKSSDWQPGPVEEALLEGGPEGGLYIAFAVAKKEAEEWAGKGDYRAALGSIAKLRDNVDRFFDKVLVMAEDAKVRQNRLRLLGQLHELFTSIAHFSEIASEREHE